MIAGLAVATLVLTLVAAWLGWSQARWALVASLTPLTGIAILALLSLGPFMLPLVAIGWIVFALCRQTHVGEPSRVSDRRWGILASVRTAWQGGGDSTQQPIAAI